MVSTRKRLIFCSSCEAAWPRPQGYCIPPQVNARYWGIGLSLFQGEGAPSDRENVAAVGLGSAVSILHVNHLTFVHFCQYCCCLFSFLIALPSKLFSQPMILAFCSSNSQLHPTAAGREREKMGEATVSSSVVLENLSGGTDLGSTISKP